MMFMLLENQLLKRCLMVVIVCLPRTGRGWDGTECAAVYEVKYLETAAQTVNPEEAVLT
jgi:hypothetical protein